MYQYTKPTRILGTIVLRNEAIHRDRLSQGDGTNCDRRKKSGMRFTARQLDRGPEAVVEENSPSVPVAFGVSAREWRVINGHREKRSGFGHCMGRAPALLFYKAKPISGLFCEVPKSNRLSFCETKPTSHLLSADVTSVLCRLFS